MPEPLDLDALRRRNSVVADLKDVAALIAELEATRAERDELYAVGGPLYMAQNEAFDQRTRAERAEAAIARADQLIDGVIDRMGPYDNYRAPVAEDIFEIRAMLRGDQ